MRRRRVARWGTLLLSLALMITMSGLPVWAADDITETLVANDPSVAAEANSVTVDLPSTVGGTTYTTGVLAADGGTANVNADVTVTSEGYEDYSGINVSDGSVNIGGNVNVTGAEDAVLLEGGEDVKNTVNIGGDLIAENYGLTIYAEDGTEQKVVIGGAIDTVEDSIYLSAGEALVDILVQGQLFSENNSGIYVYSNAGTAKVQTGDIASCDEAIYVSENDGTLNITVGGIYSEDDAIYISSNEGTVSVSSGTIEAVGSGSGIVVEYNEGLVDLIVKDLTADGYGMMLDENQGTINVQAGDITSEYEGIYVEENEGGEINIRMGDLTSTAHEGIDIYTEAGRIHIVTGNIDTPDDTAIYISDYGPYGQDEPIGDHEIIVKGDINAYLGGLGYYFTDDTKLQLKCTGTISSQDHPTIYGYYAGGTNVMPEITTWGLKNNSEQYDLVQLYDYNSIDYNLNEECSAMLLEQINYIIRMDETLLGAKLAGQDLSTIDIDGQAFQTLNQGEHTITVTPPAGYKILSLKSTTGTATIVANADGTFTITVPAGGEVTLSAELEKLPEDPAPAPAKKQLRKVRANSGKAAESVGAVITTFTTDEEGKEVEASKLTASTYEEFNQQLIAAIHNAPKDSKVQIATDRWYCMDKAVVDELKDHPDIEIEVRYSTALDGSTEDLLGKDAAKAFEEGDASAAFAKITIDPDKTNIEANQGRAADIEKMEDEKNEHRVPFKELGKKYKAEQIDKIYE